MYEFLTAASARFLLMDPGRGVPPDVVLGSRDIPGQRVSVIAVLPQEKLTLGRWLGSCWHPKGHGRSQWIYVHHIYFDYPLAYL
jgi:hypothetical protein